MYYSLIFELSVALAHCNTKKGNEIWFYAPIPCPWHCYLPNSAQILFKKKIVFPFPHFSLGVGCGVRGVVRGSKKKSVRVFDDLHAIEEICKLGCLATSDHVCQGQAGDAVVAHKFPPAPCFMNHAWEPLPPFVVAVGRTHVPLQIRNILCLTATVTASPKEPWIMSLLNPLN